MARFREYRKRILIEIYVVHIITSLISSNRDEQNSDLLKREYNK